MVVKRITDMNYRITKLGGSNVMRIVHIDVLKRCVEREEAVRRFVVVADKGEVRSASGISLKERHKEYRRKM